MADPSKRPKKKKSPYTADRGIPGAYDGETVTRRALFTGGAIVVANHSNFVLCALTRRWRLLVWLRAGRCATERHRIAMMARISARVKRPTGSIWTTGGLSV